ncbi:hypothetical protein ST201phi2-1p141 [Pseudomonas phage 201phi2-1]|uniref:Uncharacterized protein n=1 Tax=Pseudomonas phage 201phi2-1 TaxID=198110 RepID=B3FJ04_BP201|nr:hypothetical protein ST201phi2-1p141 [Pseudomonas phage 201phi2-1]ABY62972.1 hypothetical protein 201phi2-1p141 [Pseudomonas phage 201phi2-1]
MMSFSQYVLSKIAEESVELTKEVLKGQQQGLFSNHRGQRNVDYIRQEFIDLYARAQVLEACDDIKEQGGVDFELLPIRLDMTESNMLDVSLSVAKMCYYAQMAVASGTLELTPSEAEYVAEEADYWREHLDIHNK